MQNYIKKLLLLHSILLVQVWCPGSNIKNDYENTLHTQAKISCNNNQQDFVVCPEEKVNNVSIAAPIPFNALPLLLLFSLSGLVLCRFQYLSHNLYFSKYLHYVSLKIQSLVFFNSRSFRKHRHNECYKLFHFST